MKTFVEIIKDGNEGHSFREVIDGLMDDQIIQAAEEFANQDKWISVEKEKPKSYERVLCEIVVTGKSYQSQATSCGYWQSDKWIVERELCEDDLISVEVVAWQPIDAPSQ